MFPLQTTAFRLSLLLGATVIATAAQAQTSQSGHSNAHDNELADAGEIVVSGHPPVDFGILAATTSIQGDTLIAETRGQIGEILDSLPGVSATSFSPGASRPVVRGFSGDRVAILTDGIGSIDASNVSADHAVVFDPLSVDHIDVFQGPAVLLFGGNAIGGAVNALDKRIPRRVPDRISGTVIGGYAIAADERSLGGAIDLPLAPKLAAHVDASWRKSDDLRVGGFVNAPALRANLFDEAEHLRMEGEIDEAGELTDLANLKGRIPNSAARTFTLGGGVAFIDTGGDIGLSVQRFDTQYGVPLRPGTEEHHGPDMGGDALREEASHEAVAIDLVQTRVDLRANLKFSGLFESLQFRGAYGDYEHVELEGGEVGTRFTGKGGEMRADLVQAERSGWRGRSGMQYFRRKLGVEGDEAFVPDNTVERLGIFTLQSIVLGSGFSLEAAGRYEHARVAAPSIAYSRAFDLWSGAAGVSWNSEDGWTFGANYVRGARGPSAEELLSDGLHVATQSYELGDPTFRAEKSNGYEAYVKYATDRATIALTGYITDFSGFITPVPTGAEFEGFPVFAYAQRDARYAGFEASAHVLAMAWDRGSLSLDAGADYTHARLKDDGPVPRIPPLRVRGGAELKQGPVRLSAEIEWNDSQTRVAQFERPVEGFTLVNLGLDYHPFGEDGPLTLIASANNIFDVNARRAASFTREFVPLPGRDIRLTAKYTF